MHFFDRSQPPRSLVSVKLIVEGLHRRACHDHSRWYQDEYPPHPAATLLLPFIAGKRPREYLRTIHLVTDCASSRHKLVHQCVIEIIH